MSTDELLEETNFRILERKVNNGTINGNFRRLVIIFSLKTQYRNPHSQGEGSVRSDDHAALKGHLSADCSSANILNIVRSWDKINKIEYTYHVNSSFDHRVTSSVIIILKIEVSRRQPPGTLIFKPWKGTKSEENDPRYQKAGYGPEPGSYR